MNERILELVNQADIKFDVSSDNYGVDTATVTPYDLEKFAVLTCHPFDQGTRCIIRHPKVRRVTALSIAGPIIIYIQF